MVTAYQQQKLDQLQGELLLLRGITEPLQIFGEANGYVFTRVNGVTVVIIKLRSPKPYGGYILPAVMTYKETGQRPNTSLDWADRADIRFEGQAGVAVRQKGHMGPIVNLNWRCDNDNCRCQKEGTAELATRNGVALQ